MKTYFLKNTSFGFFISIFALSAIGLLGVFAATYSKDSGVSQLFFNQLFFYFVGFFIFFLIGSINPKNFKSYFIVFIIVMLSLFLLLIVTLFGPEINGARRWINLGAFNLQPSELLKIAIVVVSAFCLSYESRLKKETIINIYTSQQSTLKSIKKYIQSKSFLNSMFLILFYLSSITLVLKQKSLGNSILITLTLSLILMFNVKIKIENFLTLIPFILGLLISLFVIDTIVPYLVIVILFLYFVSKKFKLNFIYLVAFLMLGVFSVILINFLFNQVLEPYQKERIESFLGVSTSNNNLYLNEDFNRQMAITAFSSGQVFGNGFMQGNLTNSKILPFAYTDFIFASLGEQFGFFGIVIILLLYIFLIIKILRIYLNTDVKFFKLICIGVCGIILFNTLQHIAMNIGLTPITGVPLPLVSYGGSSIITIFIALGIINSINNYSSEASSVDNLKSFFGFN